MPRLRRRALGRLFRKRHPPAGAQPGTLVIDATVPPRLHAICYGPERLEESEPPADGLRALVRADSVTWIDVQGLGSEEVLRSIAQQFQIHPLALEDVVNVPQRPKVEAHGDQLLIVGRMAFLNEDGALEREQVSLLLGPNYVLTFQERYGDVFDPVRARIRQGGPVFRTGGAAYLAYALLDAVVDGYFPVLEYFGERLEHLEVEAIGSPRPAVASEIHEIKGDLLGLRRAVWPMREVLASLMREDLPFMAGKLQAHLRDCYEHCVQVIDVLETYRELSGGLMDVYLSSVANRQNEVMRVLTVMASIFIPLTFLAGIYGMNFEHMPELHTRWGYPLTLVLMAGLAGLMLVYFWWKGWLGGSGRRR